MIHELSHLLLKNNSLSNLNSYILSNKDEILCNSIAGETIAPKHILDSYINRELNPNFCDDNFIEKLSKKINVSKEVIVRRLLTLNYINKNEYQSHKNSLNAYLNPKTIYNNKGRENKTKKVSKSHLSEEVFNKRLATRNITTNGKFYTSLMISANENGILSDLDLAEELDIPLYALNSLKLKFYDNYDN